jgi:hypothetical protein
MKPQKTVGSEDAGIPPSPRVFGQWGGAREAWGGAGKAWEGACYYSTGDYGRARAALYTGFRV